MQIDLFDIAEFIKVNKLEEVTNPVIYNKGGNPSDDGLLSTSIFGVSMSDRKKTYAYIDLHGTFFNPFIYKLLKRINRNFEHIVHSTKRFRIDNGSLVEDENGETGIGFLYKNWEKINFEKNNSLMRNQRIDVLNAYKKNVLFCKYWIVMPAFYRDVNYQAMKSGKLSHRELNLMYSKLIRMCGLLKDSNSFDFVLSGTEGKIQELLVEIYDWLKSRIDKKQGMIRKDLLGKSVDYGARVVISAPTFHENKYDEMDIDFYHSGVPLSYCCSLFTPFITAWVRNYFKREFEQSGNKYPIKTKSGQIEFVKLDDPELFFNDEYIKKQIDRFIKAPGDRFTPIELPVKDSKEKVYLTFSGRIYNENVPEEQSSLIERPATWCDILYQAAVDVTSDKMVYITRYPILDYFGSFPSQITVLSTLKTMPVYINGKVYTKYPVIDLNESKDKILVSFHDTVSMSNLYLKGLGGDYDGDQISIRGIFSQEANKEAYEKMKSKTHILNVYGSNMRTTTNEGIQTLYMLTKFE